MILRKYQIQSSALDCGVKIITCCRCSFHITAKHYQLRIIKEHFLHSHLMFSPYKVVAMDRPHSPPCLHTDYPIFKRTELKDDKMLEIKQLANEEATCKDTITYVHVYHEPLNVVYYCCPCCTFSSKLMIILEMHVIFKHVKFIVN